MKNTMDTKTKGILTLLIHEIQEIIKHYYDDDPHEGLVQISNLLCRWIKPNDLHIERVKKIPKEFIERVELGDQKVWDEIFEWYEKGEII